jgi:FlaA1/EpsC-like NDP-sugar epimerase
VIAEFYKDRHVLITGATGFMGKVLVEKLLRCCPDLSTISVLVRPKKGKKSNERIQDIVSCPVSVRLCSHRAVAPSEQMNSNTLNILCIRWLFGHSDKC